MTLHDPGHFDEPHHQVLEVLCAKALENGDVETAYRLSDRRCRIRPLPDVHAYVLRAEALHRMGIASRRWRISSRPSRSLPMILPPIEECCSGAGRGSAPMRPGP